jgi:hypothetical protein
MLLSVVRPPSKCERLLAAGLDGPPAQRTGAANRGRHAVPCAVSATGHQSGCTAPPLSRPLPHSHGNLTASGSQEALWGPTMRLHVVLGGERTGSFVGFSGSSPGGAPHGSGVYTRPAPPLVTLFQRIFPIRNQQQPWRPSLPSSRCPSPRPRPRPAAACPASWCARRRPVLMPRWCAGAGPQWAWQRGRQMHRPRDRGPGGAPCPHRRRQKA